MPQGTWFLTSPYQDQEIALGRSYCLGQGIPSSKKPSAKVALVAYQDRLTVRSGSLRVPGSLLHHFKTRKQPKGAPAALVGEYPPPRSLVLKWPKLPTRTDLQKDRDTSLGYLIPYFSISRPGNSLMALLLPWSGNTLLQEAWC